FSVAPGGNESGDVPSAKEVDKGPQAKEVVKVRGRVLDPDGKPLAGARLYLGSSSPKALTKSVRATSGDDGRFAFTLTRSERGAIRAGNLKYQVMAIAWGHGCDWVAVGPAKAELTLRLVKDVPIRGRILDPDGKPVAGARIKITSMSAAKGEDL